MTAPRRPTLAERVDILTMRVLSLESAVGLDKVEAVLLKRIAAEGPTRAPLKAARRKKDARP